jgi:hypothetical protein
VDADLHARIGALSEAIEMERSDFDEFKCMECGAAFHSQAELIAHNTAMHADTDEISVPHL